MQVQVKLMGSLKAHAPDGDTLELPEGATIQTAVDQLGIDSKAMHVVMVNSKPQRNRESLLSPGDEITIIPPVSGG
jgi:molybdopterin converting factor small subunit